MTSPPAECGATPQASKVPESFFPELADTIDAALYVVDVREHRTMYASSGFERLWNIDPAWIARTGYPWLTLVHPDDRHNVQTWTQNFSKHGVLDAEYRVVLPDQRIRWVHDRATAVTRAADGTVQRAAGVITDVTARREFDGKLARAQERLTAALRAAHAGAWEWDAHSGVIEWTPEQFALYGLDDCTSAPSPEQWLDMVHSDDRDMLRALADDALNGRSDSWHVTFRVLHAAHGERWILGLGEVVRDPTTGATLRLAGINLDVTEQRRIELALESAKREAELANAAKSRFLAAASHDLRQPLQTITLVLELLARTTNPTEIQSHVQTLSAAARSMDDLLAALLDINRLETGAIAPQVDNFAISTLLAPLRSDLGHMAASKSLLLTIDDCEAIVRTDPALLAVILRNLIGNAIKYTERGAVSVTFASQSDALQICIRDTGIGISAQHLDRIFEEFYQIDNPNRDRRRGIGLGLSIVQKIAKLLGLAISVQSTEGVGSAFTVSVPLTKAKQTTPRLASTAMRRTVISSNKTPITILHIEDDAAIAKSMSMLLKLEGYDVTSATSAQAAVQLITDVGFRPDLIVTDYQLPAGATGIEVTRAIAAHLGRRPPTILLTGDISEQLKSDAKSAVDCILPKPVDIEQLLGAIQEFGAPLRAPH